MHYSESFDIDNRNTFISKDTIIQAAELNISILKNNGIRIQPASRIMQYCEYLKDCNRNPENISLFINELIKYHQSQFELSIFNLILDQFKNICDIYPWSEYFQEMIGGDYFPQNDNINSRPRNKQFELYIGALLQQAGFKVNLEEPDLTFEIDNYIISLAAKRIKSENKILKNAKNAINQISKNNINGIIALDISQVFNPENNFLITLKERAGLNYLEAIIETFTENYYAKIFKRAFNTNSFGLLIYATTLENENDLRTPKCSTKIMFLPLCNKNSKYYNVIKNLAIDIGKKLK